MPKPPSEPAFDAPLWDWPAPFDLEYPCLLAAQGNLWAWQPRTIVKQFGSPLETVAFRDDRNVTLLLFEPGQRQALPVAIRFEKDSAPFDPFEPKRNSYSGWFHGFSPPTPHCLATADGLFISCAWATPGHWLLSKSDLEVQMKLLRGKLPTTATPGGAK